MPSGLWPGEHDDPSSFTENLSFGEPLTAAARFREEVGVIAGALELRCARPADVDAVRGVVRHAFARYVSRIGREPAPMSADYRALVAERAVTVALHGDSIVGVLVLRPQSQPLLLEIVAVTPAAQGRGVGRALIACAEQHACGLGLAKVALYTNARMTENLSFYPNLGYVEVGRRSEGGFDRVFFEKTVAASS